MEHLVPFDGFQVRDKDKIGIGIVEFFSSVSWRFHLSGINCISVLFYILFSLAYISSLF